jgi:hypothetical protein
VKCPFNLPPTKGKRNFTKRLNFSLEINLICYYLEMEKGKPHYALAEIKALVAREGLRVFTATARQGVLAMALTATEALSVIAALDHRQF